MMTRKDYVKFAELIRAELNTGHRATLEEFARNLADLLADDNPNFNRARFLEACGLEAQP